MRRGEQDGLRLVEDRLMAPLADVDFAGLLDCWVHEDVVVTAIRPKELEDCPDLPLRIRGALGNMLALHRDNGAFDPGPFGRADTFDFLFDWSPPGARGGEIAQPAIILADVVGGRVEVRFRLFGLAMWHGVRVLHALVDALESGVSVRNGGVRARFGVVAAHIERFCGAAHLWPDRASSVHMTMCTPMIIRRGNMVQITPDALLRAVVRRPATLAPWMRCRLADAGPAQPSGLTADMGDIHPEQWERFSKRERGIRKYVEGFGGTVQISGDLDPWIAWFRLGELTGLGSETALGMGMYRLHWH